MDGSSCWPIVRDWLGRLGANTLFIEPGSPWENGCCESVNGKPRFELLDTEIFYTLAEAKILIENWRIEHNTNRPHASLGQRPPAPEAWSRLLPEALPPRPAGIALHLTFHMDQPVGAGQ